MRYRAECDLIDTDGRFYAKGTEVELSDSKKHSAHLIPLASARVEYADTVKRRTRKKPGE